MDDQTPNGLWALLEDVIIFGAVILFVIALFMWLFYIIGTLLIFGLIGFIFEKLIGRDYE